MLGGYTVKDTKPEHKKSIFEKMGLIERVEDEDPINPNIERKPDAIISNSKNLNIIKEHSIQSTKETLLKTDEIYDKFNVNSSGVNTLFIIENFTKALPDYLPIEVKRDSVLNIISSSGMKLENLLVDGNDKLKCLKKFSEKLSKDTKDIVLKYENEIKILNEKINIYNQSIEDRKNLQDEQLAVIEYETQKINNIIQFIASSK